MNSSKLFDEQKFSMEISTRSMEQTLTPLVNQITTLVNYRERPIKSEKTRQLISQLSRALQSAIERFVSVGEKIALEHAEIKYEMLDACVRVRQAGADICRHGTATGQCSSPSQTDLELAAPNGADGTGQASDSPTRWSRNDADNETVSALCQKLAALNAGSISSSNSGTSTATTTATATATATGSGGGSRNSGVQSVSRPQSATGEVLLNNAKLQSVTMSGRQLLSAICRVLLLADRVVVKQLVAAIDKVSASLNRLERCATVADFSREFATFGDSMVNLGYLSGDRQNDLKDDVQRVQMSAARSVLEKSTTILLATAKTCLRLSDSDAARRSRDCVLAHMRSALCRLEKVVTQTNGSGIGISGLASSSSNGSSVEKDKEKISASLAQTQTQSGANSASPNASAAGLQSPPAPTGDAAALGSGDSGIVLQHAAVSNACAFKAARELERNLEQLASLFAFSPQSQQQQQQQQQNANSARKSMSNGSLQCSLVHFHELAARCGDLTQTLHSNCEALQDAFADFSDSPFVSVARRAELQAAISKVVEQVTAADSAARSPIDYLHAVGATRMMNVLDAASTDDELAELTRRAEASCVAASDFLRCSLLRIAFDSAIEQVCEALKVEKDTQTLLAVKLCAANGDAVQLGEFLARFDERSERMFELSKTLRHVAAHDVLVVASEHTFGVLQTLTRLVSLASDTLVRHSSVKQAKEQLDAVCDAYQQQLLDVANLVKDVNDAQHGRWSLDVARLTFLKQLTRTHSVLSLQRNATPTGSRTATQSPNASSCYLNSATLTHASQPNVASLHGAQLVASYPLGSAQRQQAVLDRSMPRAPRSRSNRTSPQLSLVDITEPLNDLPYAPYPLNASAPLSPQLLILNAIAHNSQLLSKARILDELAQPVLQFAVSRGPIRTTHELFVHCSRFCEELTQFNRALRGALTALSSQLAGMPLSTDAHGVPQRPTTDAHYQLLLFETDRLSALTQQFNATVRVQTAGRAQTFQKVDSLIQLVRATLHSVHNKILLVDASSNVPTYDASTLPHQSAGSLHLHQDASSYTTDRRHEPVRVVDVGRHASLSARNAGHAAAPPLSAGNSGGATYYHTPAAHRSSGVVSDDEVAYGEYDDDYPVHSRLNLRAPHNYATLAHPAGAYASAGHPAAAAGGYPTARVSTSSQTGQYGVTSTSKSAMPSNRPLSAQSQPNPQRYRNVSASTSQAHEEPASQTSSATTTATATTNGRRTLARASSEDQSQSQLHSSTSTASTNSGVTVRQTAVSQQSAALGRTESPRSAESQNNSSNTQVNQQANLQTNGQNNAQSAMTDRV